MSLIHVENLVKRYEPDGPNAVDDLSFEVEAGEIFSLLGPNGAGKTTTLSVISTLLAPTSGRVTVDGHDTEADPMAVRRTLGVVPQELALYDDLTARENLKFWGEMRGLHGSPLMKDIDQMLQLTELETRADDRVSTYSGGMKRRLNLAVGLLGQPRLVMLDEPTVAIDPQSRRYILDWVKKMNDQGMTVLYTTHYMEEAQELSDRIGIMDQGKLIAIGTLDELTRIVGERETLVLNLVQEGKSQQLSQAVRSMDGVDEVTGTDGQVIINVAEAEAVLADIVGTASKFGVSVRTIEIREPNLETVFLHLTGRALRD
jgi:ABC-2 type transport system ATP-binding protein